MNIKRLHVFLRALQERLSSVHGSARSTTLAYWHNKKWFDSGETEIVDKELRSLLDTARKSADAYWRPAGSRSVYFWIKKFEAVAIIEFEKAIYAPAQIAAMSALGRLVEDSINEYRAAHDTHTGLRNRVAFDQALIEAIGKVSAVGATTVTEEASQSLPQYSIVLASLDIDHFKSINDRFGHGYGDIVLAALAARMEAGAQEIMRESEKHVSVDVFRLGGEEFQLLIAGEIAELEGGEVAQRIAQKIRGELLPSNKEYEWLSRTEFADGTPLPHDSDRKVTVSVGVAVAPLSKDKPLDVAKRLKRQADLALYSAKISGRDRVRYFGQILESGGRVNSIDSNNGIISIDIGREVGVKKGQEFFLYPPNYDGQTDFYLGEGRSRKRVGSFPKFRAARISAFDVQNEVSFCRVIERERDVREILEGSTLEAIPLGSISHLVGELAGGLKFEAQEAFRDNVAMLSKSSGVAVIAVSLRDIEKISEEQGLDKANECLGRVGGRVLAALKSKGKFGQASLGGFLAAMSAANRAEVKGKVKALFDDLATQNEGVAIGVGWSFLANEDDAEDGGDGDAEGARLNDAGGLVDAAMLAAIFSAEKGGPREFTVSLWNSSLAMARRSGEYNRVIADFELFSALGLASSMAETQMAFVYMAGPKHNPELAEAMFRRAAGRPAGEIVTANLGCYLIAAEKADEGFLIIRDVDLPDSYLSTLFYGALRALPPAKFVEFVAEREHLIPKALDEKQAWLTRKQQSEVNEALKSAAP